MNRRTAIRNVIIIGAGASLWASCQDKASVALKNIPLTGSQEDLLSALTETIIPTTSDFAGAKEIESQKFTLMMTDDCTSPDEQKKFMAGMQLFDDECKKKYGTKFTKCTPQQREEFLLSIETKEGIMEDLVSFYQTIKRYTIQSFTSSEIFLTKIRNYSLIPGPFKGCVPVASI